MKKSPTLVWFQNDLRIADNPALYQACQQGALLPVFIWDNTLPDELPGAASKVWIHHALDSLNRALDGALQCFVGSPEEILSGLVKHYSLTHVAWNQRGVPVYNQRDARIKATLERQGCCVFLGPPNLLWEPEAIHKADGSMYKVFTPFYKRGCLSAPAPATPLPKPAQLTVVPPKNHMQSIASLQLLPAHSWSQKVTSHWEISETGAQERLTEFIKTGLSQYKNGRNTPAQPYVSQLSPYLSQGVLSARSIWHALSTLETTPDVAHFRSELGWREFSYYLLHHFSDLPTKNWNPAFDVFPWVNNPQQFAAWKKGETGYPLVDAGMRQLYETGYIHNRVRMVVASFLVKHLRIDWRWGAAWFWDCLVDADRASNSASWQWVAGCGADAAPYFRIFNPIIQGKKFDTHGYYTKRYVPELASLPTQHLFAPWETPGLELAAAGIVFGKTYPRPIVQHEQAREQALAALAVTKQ